MLVLFCRASLLCNRMHNDCQELVGRSEVNLMQVCVCECEGVYVEPVPLLHPPPE